jgi:hypothetical protein
MLNGFFEYLTPITLGAHNFLILNLFSTIFSVLDAPRGGLEVYLDTRSKKTLPWLLYSNTLVASYV